jgi:hypothetical protein
LPVSQKKQRPNKTFDLENALYYNNGIGEKMQQITVRQQINKRLEILPVNLQKKVLSYITRLSDSGIPHGIPGKKLVRLAGGLDKEDADELLQIIEEGCERIDYNEW